MRGQQNIKIRIMKTAVTETMQVISWVAKLPVFEVFDFLNFLGLNILSPRPRAFVTLHVSNSEGLH